jgi:Tripartite tricarboxylate transporter family receptor
MTISGTLKVIATLSTAVAALLPAVVHAQDNWPGKPITMVVPFPPGGVADTVGRPVAIALGRELKQSVIVENKGGAGGAIGMAQVARAALPVIAAQADRPLHGGPDGAGGSRRQPMEKPERIRRCHARETGRLQLQFVR